MPMRTLLVSVDGTEGGLAPLEAALDLVVRFGVHADVLHVRADPLEAAPALGEGSGARMTDDLTRAAMGESERRCWKAREAFYQICANRKIPVVLGPREVDGSSAAWIEMVGRKHETMSRLGRVHDLIVTGKPSDKRHMAESLTLDALFHTGRPVLVVPEGMPERWGGRIAIAWNGSPECARAVGSATHFLARAGSVVVLTAESARTPASVVAELATYLEWHGMKPETRIFAHMGRRRLGGRPLLEACAAEGADLLVMGASSTPRLRRLLLGPATRQVLALAGIPVLMGH